MPLVARKITLAAIPLGLMATILVSGCSHSDDAPAADASTAAHAGGSPPSAAPSAQTVQSIEANPHIPPQAKAAMVRQLQGGPPNAAETSAPHK